MSLPFVSIHERIIFAAVPLFAQRGIRQVTKEEVQRVAGVSVSEFWHVLVTGSITNAIEGDDRAASRAKEMGRALIAEHRPHGTAYPLAAEDVESSDIAYRAIDDYDGFLAMASTFNANLNQMSSVDLDAW